MDQNITTTNHGTMKKTTKKTKKEKNAIEQSLQEEEGETLELNRSKRSNDDSICILTCFVWPQLPTVDRAVSRVLRDPER